MSFKKVNYVCVLPGEIYLLYFTLKVLAWPERAERNCE
jgi:hypothetical protein